ncbi:hypothetical protein DPMN_004758 [Dreissena polymorpha]|uniref:Uncharacterized protein n=1 Tax=Dreissena polymorpha TaxID=45954 RepID=A0A9D4MQW8_DREPO|nr:hypothetical protein DPMN_004758 [Dreissena polymorpha]
MTMSATPSWTNIQLLTNCQCSDQNVGRCNSDIIIHNSNCPTCTMTGTSCNKQMCYYL